MAKKRRSEPTALGELVPAVFGKNNGTILVSVVSAVWERMLPPRVVKNASPTRLRGGVLHVETTTSAWAHELTLMAPGILAALKTALPTLEIESIRVRAGLALKRAGRQERRGPQVTPLAEAALPTDLRDALARLDDDSLRDVLTRAARQSLAHAPKTPPRQ